MLIVLPNGAELEEPPQSTIKPVGDRGIPSPAFYRQPGSVDEPGFELTIEVWDGIPVCTEVRLTAKPENKAHIRVKDIKEVASQLENLVEDWLSLIAYVPHGEPGNWMRALGSAELRAAALKSVRTARRKVRRKGTGHFQKVADTYNAAGASKTDDVAAAFGVSYRTAQRYIEKARAAGFIDD